MRTDVFKERYNRNLEQYFYFLELGDAMVCAGRKNHYKSKLAEISEAQKNLDSRYYKEMKQSDTQRWYALSLYARHQKKEAKNGKI